MTVNVNVIGLLMNTSQVLIHSMLNWNLELLGKPRYPEKKPLRARALDNKLHPHCGVNVIHKSLNQNTAFASSTILLIGNNSN